MPLRCQAQLALCHGARPPAAIGSPPFHQLPGVVACHREGGQDPNCLPIYCYQFSTCTDGQGEDRWIPWSK